MESQPQCLKCRFDDLKNEATKQLDRGVVVTTMYAVLPSPAEQRVDSGESIISRAKAVKRFGCVRCSMPELAVVGLWYPPRSPAVVR